MKTFFLTLLSALLIVSCSFAGKPPAAVQNSFETKFPDASKVSWGKESPKEWESDKTETLKNGTIYEADLKNGKEKKSVAFKENGSPVAE